MAMNGPQRLQIQDIISLYRVTVPPLNVKTFIHAMQVLDCVIMEWWEKNNGNAGSSRSTNKHAKR